MKADSTLVALLAEVSKNVLRRGHQDSGVKSVVFDSDARGAIHAQEVTHRDLSLVFHVRLVANDEPNNLANTRQS